MAPSLLVAVTKWGVVLWERDRLVLRECATGSIVRATASPLIPKGVSVTGRYGQRESQSFLQRQWRDAERLYLAWRATTTRVYGMRPPDTAVVSSGAVAWDLSSGALQPDPAWTPVPEAIAAPPAIATVIASRIVITNVNPVVVGENAAAIVRVDGVGRSRRVLLERWELATQKEMLVIELPVQIVGTGIALVCGSSDRRHLAVGWQQPDLGPIEWEIFDLASGGRVASVTTQRFPLRFALFESLLLVADEERRPGGSVSGSVSAFSLRGRRRWTHANFNAVEYPPVP